MEERRVPWLFGQGRGRDVRTGESRGQQGRGVRLGLHPPAVSIPLGEGLQDLPGRGCVHTHARAL